MAFQSARWRCEFQGTPWSNESDPNMPEGDTNAPDATTYNIGRLAAQFTIYSYDKRTTFRIKQILIEDIAVEETFELRLSFILYNFKVCMIRLDHICFEKSSSPF